MKYQTWGVDKTFNSKLSARVYGFLFWVKRMNIKQSLKCLTHKY